jgi:hypothetical protein
MSDVQNVSDVQPQEMPQGQGSAPAQNQPPQGVPEPEFDLEGSKVPLSEVKKWRESHTTAEKWRSENTRKAQENAQAYKELQSIKEWKEKNPNYEKEYNQYRTWNQVLENDKELYSYLEKYLAQKHSNGAYQTALSSIISFRKGTR